MMKATICSSMKGKRSPLHGIRALSPMCNIISTRARPLPASFSSQPRSTCDPNQVWKDWFQGPSYQNIFSKTNNDLPRLSNNVTLQNKSLFLLSLLRRQSIVTDRHSLTLERCHVVLHELSDASTLSADETLITRAQWAHVILNGMEFHFNTRTKSERLESHSPRPSRFTYDLVLSLCAQSMQLELAMQIIKQMTSRVEEGYLDVRPNIITWNQLIRQVADSDPINSWDKSYHASWLLVRMEGQIMQKEGHINDKESGEVNISGLFKVHPDPSSYGHVFRACATSNPKNEKACLLAGRIAIKVWKDLQDSDLFKQENDEVWTEQQTYLFMYATQSMKFLPDGSSKNEVLSDIFHACCRFGLLNDHVLSSFEAVSSPKLWDDIIEKTLLVSKKEGNFKRFADYRGLLSKIPPKFKRKLSKKASS